MREEAVLAGAPPGVAAVVGAELVLADRVGAGRAVATVRIGAGPAARTSGSPANSAVIR
jgi:hypothetical protein